MNSIEQRERQGAQGKAGSPDPGVRLVPVVRRVSVDTETPVSTYLKVARGPWSFLFESVEGGTRWARYSMVGFDPFVVFEAWEGKAVIRRAREWECGPGAGGSVVEDFEVFESDDPVAALRGLLAEFRMPKLPGLARLSGGLVGYFAYGASRILDPASAHRPTVARGSGAPLIRLFAPRTILAFDNVDRTLDIMVSTACEGDGGVSASRAARARGEIDAILERLGGALPGGAVAPTRRPAARLEPLVSRSAFEDMVVRAREAVHAGEAIQVVVSQPFEAECDLDPFTCYRTLRALDPTPYLFHLDLGDEALVGASPEVMLRVEDGRGTLRPIAGTRPRGLDADRDRALEEDLLSDLKERAEHVMLVDLGRNDLGRVAAPGTVRLEESFAVERYSHVMHLVSTVSAGLRPGLDGLDALSACFPAGTVSGAPKVRAMELIAELEARPRGAYAGAVGYLGFDGDLDTCIAIRTMHFQGGRVRLQAGAGVVADSDPALEYEETLHKARALRRALESAAAGLVPAQPQAEAAAPSAEGGQASAAPPVAGAPPTGVGAPPPTAAGALPPTGAGALPPPTGADLCSRSPALLRR